ncbi:MAG: hypothetical protein AAF614_25785 [Chloroflexota bacterium]
MGRQVYFCGLLIMVLLLAACFQDEEPPEATPTPTVEATQITTFAMIPTATPTLPPTATPTPTPTATPIPTSLQVSNQILTEDGRLTISRVTSPLPAWVVVVAPLEDGTEMVLGQTAVSAGIHEDIVVEIEPLEARPNLAARLHDDSEETDQFDFPEGDAPLDTAIAFTIDIDLPRPIVTIAEQEIDEDGLLQVETIFSPMAGWLKIHADDNGAPGAVVAETALAEGLNENLVLNLRWREATPQLYAVLYEDEVEPGVLNSEAEDGPLLVNGDPAVEPFRVSLPPDVIVYDQPVVNGRFAVDYALSSGPGWLVVYLDEAEEPGAIIGFAPLEDGVNRYVEVELGQTAVTEQLFIIMHADDDPVGTFDFPQLDKPFAVGGQIPAPFMFQTAPGNYLVTQDQTVEEIGEEETAVTVPITVTDVEAWLVIYNSTSNGTDDIPNEILGNVLLPVGINHNILVNVPTEELTETLFAVLHLDAPPLEAFDFPEGNDVPLRRRQTPIQAAFTVSQSE